MLEKSIDLVCEVLGAHRTPILELIMVRDKLVSGELQALVVESEAGRAALVFSEKEGWRQVEVARGPDDAVLDGVRRLKDGAAALLWLPSAMTVSDEALDALGVPLVSRQEFLQDLTKVPETALDLADIELRPLETKDVREARMLYARAHAGNVAGVFSTWPLPPTVARCADAFDADLSGGDGATVPSACLVAHVAGRMLGVVTCIDSGTDSTAVLMGLAVDPTERRRGLSRILVRGAQDALKRAGFGRMRFFTTDSNLPVHRLFTPEEILSTSATQARVWLKPL